MRDYLDVTGGLGGKGIEGTAEVLWRLAEVQDGHFAGFISQSVEFKNALVLQVLVLL